MNKLLRKPVIAGNWKMNKTPEEASALIEEMKPLLSSASCEIVLCVPYVDLQAAVLAAEGSKIKIGAENCHWAESGAFTGEISAGMLVSMKVDYVIIGHSERRQLFGESNDTAGLRVKAAADAGLKVILCVGESLDEREKNITFEIIAQQLKTGLSGISEKELGGITIAYEPVWAIGTGRTATSEQAGEVAHFIRELVSSLYSPEAAKGLAVLYGGSMKPSNAAELLAKEDIDGGLIGGASLKAEDFAKIVEAAE